MKVLSYKVKCLFPGEFRLMISQVTIFKYIGTHLYYLFLPVLIKKCSNKHSLFAAYAIFIHISKACLKRKCCLNFKNFYKYVPIFKYRSRLSLSLWNLVEVSNSIKITSQQNVALIFNRHFYIYVANSSNGK